MTGLALRACSQSYLVTRQDHDHPNRLWCMAFLAAVPELLAVAGEAGAAGAATAGAAGAAEAGAGAAVAGAGAAEAGADVGAGATEASSPTFFQKAQGMVRDFNDSPVGKVVGSRTGRAVISGVGQGVMQARQQPRGAGSGGANIGQMGNL